MITQEKLDANKWGKCTPQQRTFYSDNAYFDIYQDEVGATVRGNLFGADTISGIQKVFEKFETVEQAENFVAEKI